MPTNDLTQKHCVPCEGGVAPLSFAEAEETMKHVPGWMLGENGKEIVRYFHFKNFKEVMVFVNKVATIAENEGHHPDMLVSYKDVTVTLTTHAIGGLSTNDFILAARVNALMT